VGAKPLPKRSVQEVGGGVVSHRGVAQLSLDFGLHPLAGRQIARTQLHLQRLVLADPIDVRHPGLATVPAQQPGVGDLTAALGVEGALLQLHQGPPVVGDHRAHAGRGP
jgi:hypothetical protein